METRLLGTDVIVAVVFFGLVAAMYGAGASSSLKLVYAIIAPTVLGTVVRRVRD